MKNLDSRIRGNDRGKYLISSLKMNRFGLAMGEFLFKEGVGAERLGFSNLKQSSYVIPCDFFEEIAGFADERIKEKFLAFLELKNFFFYRSFGDKFIHIHGVFLPDAMRSINCLIFRARIPPRVKDDDIVRRRQSQPGSSGFQTYQKHSLGFVFVERSDDFFPIVCFAGEVGVSYATAFQLLRQNIKHSRELAED